MNTKKFFFEKLVRDKSVERVEAGGEKAVHKKLCKEDFVRELKSKLVEESREILASKEKNKLIAELADLKEVFDALAEAEGVTKKEIVEAINKKTEERGSFNEAIYINFIETNDGSYFHNYCLKDSHKYPEIIPEGGNVEVVPPSEGWKDRFQKEKSEIEKIFGEKAKEIHHIGSTSIPCYAKPVIDILVIVDHLLDADDLMGIMRRFGWKAHGEGPIHRRRLFIKSETEDHDPISRLHCLEPDNPQVDNFLRFRNSIRENEKLKEKYVSLKRGLAEKFKEDRGSYLAGKAKFVSDVLDGKIK